MWVRRNCGCVMGARVRQSLMRSLGHQRFCAAGHDRDTYVAHRLAMDHPGLVSRLCLMEGIPIGEALARRDAKFAASWYHWFFLGQTERPAERYINADPDAWYAATAEHMGQEAYEDYRCAIHDPDTVHAMVEDYRAGLGIDREHDDADRAAGRRITCPLLFLWAAKDDLEYLYGDPLAIWRDWADDVRGQSVDCGHHIAEEAPRRTRCSPDRILHNHLLITGGTVAPGVCSVAMTLAGLRAGFDNVEDLATFNGSGAYLCCG